jgi:hypothetical protein
MARPIAKFLQTHRPIETATTPSRTVTKPEPFKNLPEWTNLSQTAQRSRWSHSKMTFRKTLNPWSSRNHSPMVPKDPIPKTKPSQNSLQTCPSKSLSSATTVQTPSRCSQTAWLNSHSQQKQAFHPLIPTSLTKTVGSQCLISAGSSTATSSRWPMGTVLMDKMCHGIWKQDCPSIVKLRCVTCSHSTVSTSKRSKSMNY